MEYGYRVEEGRIVLTANGKDVAYLRTVSGAADTLTEIEPGAWRWTRRTEKPVSEMRMEMDTAYSANYTMVPAVNYNGNGWGDSVEYTGDNCNGIPWTYAYHRCTIPACTYTEGPEFGAAMMCEDTDKASCSLYKPAGEEFTRHALIWPEQEGPKVLYRHEWAVNDYMGAMEPRSTFDAVITVFPIELPRHQVRTLLDFAWRYYGHDMKPEFNAQKLWELSIAFMKSLWTLESDGFVAFNRGLQWYPKECYFGKRNAIRYEIGWVGQSASASNALLENYLRTGDKDSLDKAIACLDAWIKFTHIEGAPHGLRYIKFDSAPSVQERYIPLDACNLGQGAFHYFEAYDKAKKCGLEKPEYLDFAYGICDFAVNAQHENGEFAKSWNHDGTVNQQSGTIGCFLIPPLVVAYEKSGDRKYLDAAVRAFDCYYAELYDNGFTTAGALDTYCIDKESASPLLSAAISLYDATKDKKYITAAEYAGWYISTWMMHYTAIYPEESVLTKIGYDSMGATAVSTAHNAIDQYALHDVISFMRLAELTGNRQWHERALAFWFGASQLISDGTLCISGRVRPAGSQDEAVFHTRWGRPGLAPFNPSQWLVMWPCAFRMEILRYIGDTAPLDSTMTVENAIK